MIMYRYIGLENDSLNLLKYHTTEINGAPSTRNLFPFFKLPAIIKVCNPYQGIVAGSEGCNDKRYILEGLLILIRHGDRGPLTHVQNISSVNCVGPYDPLYTEFESYIDNITGTSALSQLLGTFHGIPPLPGIECGLGLLTRIGASQLLATGKALRNVYKNLFHINSSLVKEEIKAYSTRYRRTLQSALAFLFTFLNIEHFQKVTLQEAPSLSFCFDDCACPAADHYHRKFVLETYHHLRTHPSILNLVKSSSSVVYEFTDRKISTDPHALKDALLTYVCHGANLPCADIYSVPESCIKMEHINSLFNYIDWETKVISKSENLRRECLLRAYGLLKNIISHLLRIVSEKRPRIVLYSGHDKTLSYLATALGVTGKVSSPQYASRLIFEVYRSNDQAAAQYGPVGSDYYFRLLFNGKDITNRIQFCKTSSDLNSHKELNFTSSKSVNFYLCPLESIVRFLHDDYFAPFNATNIRDACTF
ncbi:2-phosphoxylose phosphatase 1 isoform X2 [Rhodnius prolixus]|uniref:2-phosphoxylose phosphatase 1 isoform X2 n=1 Tax=Rhodnius prolixus TaxID=13249 RepID=UPI003D18C116